MFFEEDQNICYKCNSNKFFMIIFFDYNTIKLFSFIIFIFVLIVIYYKNVFFFYYFFR
jgi:hypothetical protein